ncbi:MAG: DNA mismatch repair endonuclease MutL [Lachnospiraceae bacterium]
MGKIQVLDQSTINQIAAGEVIERPASVVKELMENAIDAMATAVTVEIKDGGISFIRITDNGAGMAKEDVKTAFLRHATSKIKSALDLLTVSSLGFRGEALSSISAVSMVELVTKRKEDFLGTRYETAGGKEGNIEEVGVPDGTTFIVRNLFYNTPARRKFLKTAMTEAGYINDIVSRMAMAHPEISIRFINNGKHILHTSGNGNLKDVIYSIFGKDIALNLLELNTETPNIKIMGYIGKPLISRGNRTYENYFINGRYIKSGIINKAIEEGYRSFMMQHKYPFTAIHFSVNPQYIDVNVHPAKLEIRFRNGEEIYPVIINAISEALRERELIPEAVFEDKEKNRTDSKKGLEKTPEYFEENRISKNNQETITKNTPLAPEIKVTFDDKTKKVESIKVKKPEIIYNSLKENEKECEKALLAEEPLKYDAKNTGEAYENSISSEKSKNEQMELFDDKLLSKEARIKHEIVGQVFDTYWIVQYGDKMFIIDQHAAHEKVLYERAVKRLKDRKAISQSLNPPIILSLNLREEETVKEYIDYFKELGYEIEEFGGREYAVRAVPFDLFSVAKKELLMEIIDDLSDDAAIKRQSGLILDRIATMSCKAAVKGNNKLSLSEANALIDELMSLENPYNCPHGRPTIVSMSKYELEKKFKRIV